MALHVIIVEDELHNYRLLRGMIEKIRPEWNISGPFESVKKSVEYLQVNPKVDLIFMDIQLTDGICFSIFEKVKVESMVIFTTAYDNYALQAFNVNSVDYLLKPVKEVKLEEAIQKFERFNQKTHSYPDINSYQEIFNAIKNKEKKYRKRFLISGAQAFFKLNVEDIALFYTENRITYAVTFKGEEYHLDFTLEKLEEELDPDEFFRANRSYIIHSDAIHKIENYFGGKLFVKTIAPLKNHDITISRLKATEFKNWIGR